MKSVGTLALLLFTALATAAFVWMTQRPAIDNTALTFGMPSEGTATSSSASSNTSPSTAVNAVNEPALSQEKPAAPSTPNAPTATTGTMEKPAEPSTPKAPSPENMVAPETPKLEAPKLDDPKTTAETDSKDNDTANADSATKNDESTMTEKAPETTGKVPPEMETIQMTVPAGMEEEIQKAIENAINSANSNEKAQHNSGDR